MYRKHWMGLASFLATLRMVAGATTVLAGTYDEAIDVSAPTAYWRFDDATSGNSDTVADSSGNGHNGIYLGGTAPIVLTGDTPATISGTSVTLDGVDDYIDTTTLGNVGGSIAAGVTFEFWMKTDNATDFGRVFGTFNTGSNTTVVLGVNSNQISATTPGSTQLFLRRDGGGDLSAAFNDTTSGVDLYDGQWHHVVWRLSDVPNQQFDVTVDLQPVALTYGTTAVGSYSNFQHDFFIGTANNRGTGPFASYTDAQLDEMAVYSRSLNDGEIIDHYNAATGALLAYEGFDYAGGTDLGGHPTGGENGGVGFSAPWTTPSGASGGSLKITSGGFSRPYPAGTPFVPTGVYAADGDGGANRRALAGPGIDFSAEGDVYYLSAILQKDTTPGGGSEWLQLHLVDDNAGTMSDDIKFFMGYSSGEQLHLGANPGQTGSDIATGASLTDDDYFFVAKIITHSTAQDELFLKVFGGSPTDSFDDLVTNEPTLWDLTNTIDQSGIADSLQFSVGPNTVARFDEFRLGTSWFAVTGVVPEPNLFVLGLSGALVLAPLLRRRKKRSVET